MKVITATCNPYHAKFHFNGERVIKYNGITPVKWVIDDNFGDGFPSEEAAAERLMEMAKECCFDGRHANWAHNNDADIDALRKQVKEDHNEEINVSWYKGAGVYDVTENSPVILNGETSFEDDTMTYQVEDVED